MENVKREESNQKFNDFFQQKIYVFTLDLVKFLDGLSNESLTRTIKNQVLRCGTSIGANQMEAQSASSRKDFANFYHYSLKSANETKFWLNLLKDSGRSNAAKVKPLLESLDEISKILGSALIKLKEKKDKCTD